MKKHLATFALHSHKSPMVKHIIRYHIVIAFRFYIADQNEPYANCPVLIYDQEFQHRMMREEEYNAPSPATLLAFRFVSNQYKMVKCQNHASMVKEMLACCSF